LRVNEASVEKRTEWRYIPCVAKKDETKMMAREESTAWPRFQVSYKELLSMPGVVNKLKFLHKKIGIWGSRRDTWCEFHKAFGHDIERCMDLGHQLASLVRERFLKEYLVESQEEPKGESVVRDQVHEASVHGELNTISGSM